MVVEEAVLAAHRTFIKLMEILSVPTDIIRKLAIFQAAGSWKMPDLESKCITAMSAPNCARIVMTVCRMNAVRDYAFCTKNGDIRIGNVDLHFGVKYAIKSV